MFLKILQNSYENICVGVFFIKNFFVKKETLWHWCFSVNSAKSLITLSLKNTCERLLVTINRLHCVKSVRIRSYSGPHFCRIFAHSNAGKCGKNTDQNNSEHGHFLRGVSHRLFWYKLFQKWVWPIATTFWREYRYSGTYEE